MISEMMHVTQLFKDSLHTPHSRQRGSRRETLKTDKLDLDYFRVNWALSYRIYGPKQISPNIRPTLCYFQPCHNVIALKIEADRKNVTASGKS